MQVRDLRRTDQFNALNALRPCKTLEDITTLLDGPSVFSQLPQPLERIKNQWQHQQKVLHSTVKTFPPRTSQMAKAPLLHLLKQVVLWDWSKPFVYTPEAPTPLADGPGVAGIAAAEGAANTPSVDGDGAALTPAAPAWFKDEEDVDAFMSTTKGVTKQKKGIKAQLTRLKNFHKLKIVFSEGGKQKSLPELAEYLKLKLREVPATPTDMDVDAQPLVEGPEQAPTAQLEVDTHQPDPTAAALPHLPIEAPSGTSKRARPLECAPEADPEAAQAALSKAPRI